MLNIVTTVSSLSPTSTSSLLDGIHSSTNPNDTLPVGSICESRVLASLCSAPFGGYLISGGCTTIAEQCTPPELLDSQCAQQGSAGAFVVQNAPITTKAAGKKAAALVVDDEDDDDDDELTNLGRALRTLGRPRRPKQAVFAGCCVRSSAPRAGVYGRRTCKKIRVGRRYQMRGLKTLVMNPLKQLSSCRLVWVCRDCVAFWGWGSVWQAGGK